MIESSSNDSSPYKTLSRLAIYIVLFAWVFLTLYIFSITQYEGLESDILKYFLSTEQSGIRFRALMLLAPFALSVMGYLVNEKAKLFQKTLLAERYLRQRSRELEKLNDLLTKEIMERKRAEEQLVSQALSDSLTNLPNRALFMDHVLNGLERQKRHAEYTFAVLFLDVDRFKVINDGLGHLIGDQLLILLSQRLKKCIRAVDTLARFGGDEFAILMEDVKEIWHVDYLVDRIENEMRLPFHVFGHEIFTAVSIGIAFSNLTDYSHPDEIIRDADIAMYQAKARGKACHVTFDLTMQAEVKTALWVETELRKALGNNEFVVHYQPIISMVNNKIIGFEALVRWNHPERGFLSPLDFMTVAEETGLIIPIGEWVIHEACRQLRQWQEQFPDYRDLTVSVNISSKVFSLPDFYEVIVKILHETGLAPSCLRLEIVERMLIENPEPAADLLKRLKDLNVRFDIDDFGTGYSALNYLRHFPIDGLKIDRSFINALTTDKNNSEIVKTIIALANNLKLDVIAEGIETTEQMEMYRTMKGGYAQGFFIFRPMDSKAIENILNAKA